MWLKCLLLRTIICNSRDWTSRPECQLMMFKNVSGKTSHSSTSTNMCLDRVLSTSHSSHLRCGTSTRISTSLKMMILKKNNNIRFHSLVSSCRKTLNLYKWSLKCIKNNLKSQLWALSHCWMKHLWHQRSKYQCWEELSQVAKLLLSISKTLWDRMWQSCTSMKSSRRL